MDIRKIIEMLDSMEGTHFEVKENQSGFKGYIAEEKPNGVFHNFGYTEVDSFEMDVQKDLDTMTKTMKKMRGEFPGLLTDKEYIDTAQQTITESIQKHNRSIRVLHEVGRRLEHEFNKD